MQPLEGKAMDAQTSFRLQHPSSQEEPPPEPSTPDELVGDDDETLEHPDDELDVDDAD
ncbi:hypothetical protein ACDA63_11325 [Uliginosibacterium sp. sgz301328]|uniref:hypothetical protein n=1 Tax=Uliginosibacterium sp. sgz301328 TaxID=3243764 RepID=UPI00359E3882